MWSDEEKLSICLQTTVPDVSVAQVARRYAMNANLIFAWLRDVRFAPGEEQGTADAPCFLPVEIVAHVHLEDEPRTNSDGQIEVELAGGHRLRISGSYDPETLARLIRGLLG
ncbi:MAG: IS66-like element accessory protein TnpA [Cypionkella sp.]